MKNPFVSIILVNFNGKHLLQECLEAVFENSYPPKNFEVILVDNDSQDDSVNFVKQHFPKVTVVENLQNQGFAGGSNSGYSRARGEYIVLLNTDVRVDKYWLQELVNAAGQKNVGIVCSKLYFHTPFIELKISSGIEVLSNIQKGIEGFSPVGILIEDIVCDTDKKSNLVWYIKGFYKKNEGKIPTRWTNGNATVLLPFVNDVENYSLSFRGVPNTTITETPVQIFLGNTLLSDDTVLPKQVCSLNVQVTKRQAKKNLRWLIQNTGNIIFSDGLSRDRGSVIHRDASETKEFYDFDGDYYDKPTELLAGCGASLLIKREVIEKVGLFDEAYFMYYEDIDLSLKAWRANWDIAYAPKSIGYHRHRATTNRQSSALLISLLEKNRLYLLLVHFPIHVFVKELLIFLSKLFFSFIVAKFFYTTSYYGRFQGIVSEKSTGRRLAFFELKKNLMRLFRYRLYQNKTAVRTISNMKKYLY